MRKLFRSRKALSPVVAAIILIAVTVAVSIAVAAWMGALTFTFMKTEELKFIGHAWEAVATPTYINIKVKNSGTAKLKVTDVRVNDVSATKLTFSLDFDTSGNLEAGKEGTIKVESTFAAGTKYAFEVITAAGNRFGPYTALAPS